MCASTELAERLRTIANELLLVDELLDLAPDQLASDRPRLSRDNLNEACTTAVNAAGKLAKIALELESV